MTGIWDDPPRLSNEERAAILPHVTDNVTDDELAALERGARREQLLRDVAMASLGAIIGALGTLIVIVTWFFSAA